MLALLQNCYAVMTDSGGLQKEAYFLEKPCITLRDETEWTETVNLGWNKVVGSDTSSILKAFDAIPNYEKNLEVKPYGSGVD